MISGAVDFVLMQRGDGVASLKCLTVVDAAVRDTENLNITCGNRIELGSLVHSIVLREAKK